MPAASLGDYQRPKRDGYRAHCQHSATVAVHSGGTLSGALIALGGLLVPSGAGTQDGGPESTHPMGLLRSAAPETALINSAAERSPPVPWRSAQGRPNRLHDAKRGVVIWPSSQLSVGITGSGSYTIGGSGALNMAGSAAFSASAVSMRQAFGSFTKAAVRWSTSVPAEAGLISPPCGGWDRHLYAHSAP